MEELLAAKERLVAGGIECSARQPHHLQVDLFLRPERPPPGAGGNTGTPEMMAKLDAVKWEMLEEWSQTRRAPKHAAWMHAPADA
jgi:hypothetical protein